jgi:hypothetical protein
MSYRTVIDKVLTRLREDTIGSDWSGTIASTSSLSEYQKLIGEFVNEAKDLVEDAWNWGVLRTLETVTTSASTDTYDMANLNGRSRILQVINNTSNGQLSQISDAQYYNYQYIGTTQTGQPSYFRLKDNDISFWPVPDGVYDIKVHAVQPQSDRTLAADAFSVLDSLVLLGAYSLALNERGEDGGTLTDTAATRFASALSDAVSSDELRTVNETTWYGS